MFLRLQTNDLESVYYGVKFSCYFTYREIEERWRKILYNEKAGLVSQNAILALHPDVKAKIYHDSLFSPEEDKLIAVIKVVRFLSRSSNFSAKIMLYFLQLNRRQMQIQISSYFKRFWRKIHTSLTSTGHLDLC